MALSETKLAALLADIESDQVERKESASDTDKASQAVCAFANDLPGHGTPGVLFVGVTNDGRHAGRPVTDELLRRLADLRDQGNILPPPSMSVRKVTLAGGDVVVVEVRPSNAPPVRYKGRIYIRIGSRSGIANADDERQLNERRRALDLPFDTRPLAGATRDDLNLDCFEHSILPQLAPPEVLAENDSTLSHRLTALRLLGPDGTPTAAGVLLIGRDPKRWMPGAYVQFLRLDGNNLTAAVKDEKRIAGRLLDVLRQLDDLLKLNISTSVDFTTAERETRSPDYPVEALQQIIRNAVMHRSYEHTNTPVRIIWYRDRIEVISPGGPYGTVNTANFGSGFTDYRNPTLADLMRSLGYVQRFGAGIPLAKKRLEENHNPEPTFDATPTHVAVTIRGKS